MIYKCKICGGSLEIKENDTIAVCEYCGTKQTLPRLDSDKKSSLFDRANHFRRSNEYDKAMGIYEQILADDKSDSEVYWSIVLCRYGIEYVEDPTSHSRIPTVNRVQYNSILNDEDYKKALELADSNQRQLYIEEANRINEIQAGILEVSNKEEPFDIFICYKETDENGRRTEDSVIAQNIYKELTNEGYKVFFSRITLEDKIGSAYEPYIFAALNSAKVMLTIGTKPEHFNAVWVKNEWSRYLALINKGEKKTLVPCFKNMNPYDLPEEFAYLQAQDLNKLGYMQDLIRGIQKITKPLGKTIIGNNYDGNNTTYIKDSLVKRMFNFINDKNWSKADEYSEKILDIDPDNGYAYLGKLLIEFKTTSFLNTIKDNGLYQYSINYRNMLKNADNELKAKINKAIEMEKNRINEIDYNNASKIYSSTKNKKELNEAIVIFESIINYKDSKSLIEKCKNKIKELENKEIEEKYNEANRLFESNPRQSFALFNTIREYKDSKNRIIELNIIIDKLNAEEKARRAKINKTLLYIVIIIILCAIGFCINKYIIVPNRMYNEATNLISQKKYDEAYSIFRELNKEEEITINKYKRANDFLDNEEYSSAYNIFRLIDYKDSKELADDCLYHICFDYIKSNDYINALEEYSKINNKNKYSDEFINKLVDYCNELNENEHYQEVINLLKNNTLENIKLSETLENAISNYVAKLIDSKNYDNAITVLKMSKKFSIDSELYSECLYMKALDKYNNGEYKLAINEFNSIINYSDSKDMILKCKYKYAVSHLTKEDNTTTEYLEDLIEINYADSKNLSNRLYSWNIELIVKPLEDDNRTAQKITIRAHGGKNRETLSVKLYQKEECDANNSYYCVVSEEEAFQDRIIKLKDGEEYECGWGTTGGSNTVIYCVKDLSGNILAEEYFYCY